MEQISTFIEMLDQAGIKYNVDQTMDEDGQRTLEVFVYDRRNNVAVFEFDAYASPDLMDFRII